MKEWNEIKENYYRKDKREKFQNDFIDFSEDGMKRVKTEKKCLMMNFLMYNMKHVLAM